MNETAPPAFRLPPSASCASPGQPARLTPLGSGGLRPPFANNREAHSKKRTRENAPDKKCACGGHAKWRTEPATP
jgi:hypothetical protein